MFKAAKSSAKCLYKHTEMHREEVTKINIVTDYNAGYVFLPNTLSHYNAVTS